MRALAIFNGLVLIVAAFFHATSDVFSTVALAVGFYQIVVAVVL